MGGDYFALCLTLEELARVDQSVAITLEAAVSLGAMPVYRYGSEEQKQRWLPELASGKSLAAFGLTEPGVAPTFLDRFVPGLSRTTAPGSSTAPRHSSPTPVPISPLWWESRR